MSDSAWIERLHDHALAVGVAVDLHAFDLEGAIGACYYPWSDPSSIIRLKPKDPRTTVLTLCHELGHWHSYLLFGKAGIRESTRPMRETWAFWLGWDRVIKSFGIPVDYEEWWEFHASDWLDWAIIDDRT